MKRYLVFAGLDYYPEGGWSDYEGEADTPQEATALARQCLTRRSGQWCDWAHFVDTATGVITEIKEAL